MPNYVYNVISVEAKYADRLKEISEVGLCEYYKPMPKVLKRYRSPVSIVSEEEYQKELASYDGIMGMPMTAQMQSDFIKEYGFDNWYDWSIHNWGTKWGDFERMYDDGRYSFATAWDALSDTIIELLLSDIPDLTYWWEEEQGYGAETVYKAGEEIKNSCWDKWDIVNGEFVKPKQDE